VALARLMERRGLDRAALAVRASLAADGIQSLLDGAPDEA
jgi:hypothetical protein